MSLYVFDSYALICLWRQEAQAATVQRLIDRAQAGEDRIFMSTVNYGEVLYQSLRYRADFNVPRFTELFALMPIQLRPGDRKQAERAAAFKAQGGISYADCFALALAASTEATVVTGDNEFRKFEPEVPILWL